MFPTFRHFGRSKLAAFSSVALALCGCTQRDERPAAPPPDARRAELKSEAQLAAERQERIARGEVVPTSAPVIQAEKKRLEALRAAPPTAPKLDVSADAIGGDILLVNQQSVTANEVLYALREPVEKARLSKSKLGVREQIEKLLRQQTQQEVGSILVYEKAIADLEEPQLKALESAVEREISLRVAKDFDGAKAKFAKHLETYGVRLEQFKVRLKRQMVVRSYTREILMPRVSVRREELLEHYEKNREKFSTPGSRELLMIEAPFDAFLPEGSSWNGASSEDRARAKLRAKRHISDAHAALAGKPFADVARQFSRGPHREQGGSWGAIGAPLKEPFDKLSAPIFQYTSGQFSEPIELDSGWYLIGCGKVELARDYSFAELQDRIREDLREERFNRLANDYVIKLANKSSVSGLESFLRTAVQRATAEEWPAGTH